MLGPAKALTIAAIASLAIVWAAPSQANQCSYALRTLKENTNRVSERHRTINERVMGSAERSSEINKRYYNDADRLASERLQIIASLLHLMGDLDSAWRDREAALLNTIKACVE